MKMNRIIAAILFAVSLLVGSFAAALAQNVSNTTNTTGNTSTGLPSTGGGYGY